MSSTGAAASPSTTCSFRLVEPALTTRTRTTGRDHP
jgi:hypothetical protein